MIIQSTKVWFKEKWCALQIDIEGSNIKDIYPYNMKKCDKDYGDNKILPGLIDIHTHGYIGGDMLDKFSKEWMYNWLKYLPKEGVTSIVPGTSAAPKEAILNTFKSCAEIIEEDNNDGANLLGIYSEGPFMSYDFKGAQLEEYLIVPTIQDIDEYLKASKGHMIYCMVAPEMLNDDYSVIKYLTENNVVVALGHTGANFEQVSKAKENGAKSFTHTYNGMRGLHHREPGTVGAAMYYDDMYCELIGDGIHVNPISANILARIKGKDKLISVTDAVSLKGIAPGVYPYGQNDHIHVCEDGVCRLDSGTICGSINCLNKVLKTEIETSKIDEVTAINSVTINPATLLHFNNRKGLISVNYDADLCVLDSDYNCIQTYVKGKEQL